MVSKISGQETEVKFYVKSLKQVEDRLHELGAVLIQPRVFESNLRFDTPDGHLRQEGKALRLRQDERARLTYKGPAQHSQGVRSRPELETSVEEFETARQILEALGYIPVVVYEKYRATYALGDLHIMLDEMPFGDFVEIEGLDIEALQIASEKLGLEFDAAVRGSYLFLFEGLCRKRKLDPARLTFSELEGLQISSDELSVRAADEQERE